MKRKIFAAFLAVCLLCPRCYAAGAEKYVALTFDDGPSGRFTRRLLEGLEARGVKATFLLCGYRLKDYPDTARLIRDGGHEIGLHGYSHKNMSKMSLREVERELADTRALLPEGSEAVFFRPPGGAVSEAVTEGARRAGVAVLGWSVDPRDWQIHDAGAVEAAVLGDVKDGDLILLHDLCDSSVDAALSIVDKLTGWGFRVVTVSELARIRGVTPQPGQTYCAFPAA